MARGGKDDPNFDDRFPYEPTTPDVTFGDRRVIKLGGERLQAHITAGHTQGCTTWQAEVSDRGLKKKVVFVCSTSAPGYQLAANKGYPNIAVDYERTFVRLREIKADVFLGSHGSIFGLLEKMKVLKEDPGATPFIDPDGYLKYLELSEKRFCEMLEAQQLEAQQNIKN
jgi:metallo-beta-lactamase class B